MTSTAADRMGEGIALCIKNTFIHVSPIDTDRRRGARSSSLDASFRLKHHETPFSTEVFDEKECCTLWELETCFDEEESCNILDTDASPVAPCTSVCEMSSAKRTSMSDGIACCIKNTFIHVSSFEIDNRRRRSAVDAIFRYEHHETRSESKAQCEKVASTNFLIERACCNISDVETSCDEAESDSGCSSSSVATVATDVMQLSPSTPVQDSAGDLQVQDVQHRQSRTNSSRFTHQAKDVMTKLEIAVGANMCKTSVKEKQGNYHVDICVGRDRPQSRKNMLSDVQQALSNAVSQSSGLGLVGIASDRFKPVPHGFRATLVSKDEDASHSSRSLATVFVRLKSKA